MEDKNAIYSLSAFVDKILKIYGIEPSDDVNTRLSKKVRRVCKEKGIWGEHPKPRGNRVDNYFTAEELREIVTSDEIHNYVLNNLLDAEQKELMEKSDKLLEIQQQFWSEMKMEEDFSGYYNGVTEEEVRAKKLEIMIEALFLRYFMPVDMEKLKADMDEIENATGGDIFPETIAAMERLADGKNYYKPRLLSANERKERKKQA